MKNMKTLVIILLTSIFSIGANAAVADGTESFPLQITSAADLLDFRSAVNAGSNGSYNGVANVNGFANVYFIFTNDIDLTGLDWTPIGNFSNYFRGKLNGRGHEVRNLNINEYDRIRGLFGYISGSPRDSVEIDSITIVSGSVYGSEMVGALIGRSKYAKISNCMNFINVSGEQKVGGIVGYAESSKLTNCVNFGTITVDRLSAGGIAGSAFSNSSFHECFNSGSIIGINNSYNIGGISGWGQYGCLINNSVNFGDISANTKAGGLAGGFATRCSVINSVNYGSVSATDKLGSVVGYLVKSDNSSNYYNSQLVSLKNSENPITDLSLTTALTSNQMVGSAALSILGNKYSYSNGFYPIPVGLETNNYVKSAMTVIDLHNSNSSIETVDSLVSPFFIDTVAASWTSYTSLRIEDGQIRPMPSCQSDANDTIYTWYNNRVVRKVAVTILGSTPAQIAEVASLAPLCVGDSLIVDVPEVIGDNVYSQKWVISYDDFATEQNFENCIVTPQMNGAQLRYYVVNGCVAYSNSIQIVVINENVSLKTTINSIDLCGDSKLNLDELILLETENANILFQGWYYSIDNFETSNLLTNSEIVYQHDNIQIRYEINTQCNYFVSSIITINHLDLAVVDNIKEFDYIPFSVNLMDTLHTPLFVADSVLMQGWVLSRDNFETKYNYANQTNSELQGVMIRYEVLTPCGLVHSNSSVLKFGGAPTIDNNIAATTLCAGESLNYMFDIDDNGLVIDTLGWEYSFDNFVTVKSYVANQPVTMKMNNAQFRFFVQNEVARVYSDILTLTVVCKASIKMDNNDIILCENEEIILPDVDVDDYNIEVLSSGWLLNTDSSSVLYNGQSLTNDNWYTFTYFVENSCGTSYSNSVRVFVQSTPLVEFAQTEYSIDSCFDVNSINITPSHSEYIISSYWMVKSQSDEWSELLDNNICKTTTIKYCYKTKCESYFSNEINIEVVDKSISIDTVINDTIINDTVIVIPDDSIVEEKSIDVDFIESQILVLCEGEILDVDPVSAISADVEILSQGWQVAASADSKFEYVADQLMNIDYNVYVARYVISTVDSIIYSDLFDLRVDLSVEYIFNKWNDVILIDNSSNQFVEYQWYYNGEKLNGATMQYVSQDGGLSGMYYAKVTTIDGKVFFTCPVNCDFHVEKNYGLQINPNPVREMEEFIISIMGISDDEIEDAKLYLYSINGQMIFCTTNPSLNTPMTLSAGAYVAILTLNNGTQLTAKVLVQPNH